MVDDARSPADARLGLARLLESLFIEVLANDVNADGTPLSAAQLEADEAFAVELSVEVLETLGLSVLSVDEDGSMLVRLEPDVDDD